MYCDTLVVASLPLYPLYCRYDIILRIDTDLSIKTRVPCDPFARAERYDYAFMYYASGNDGEACTRGQKGLAQKWAREKGLDTKTLDAMGGGGGEGSYSPVYHGAFHMYNLTFWNRPEVQASLVLRVLHHVLVWFSLLSWVGVTISRP